MGKIYPIVLAITRMTNLKLLDDVSFIKKNNYPKNKLMW